MMGERQIQSRRNRSQEELNFLQDVIEKLRERHWIIASDLKEREAVVREEVEILQWVLTGGRW